MGHPFAFVPGGALSGQSYYSSIGVANNLKIVARCIFLKSSCLLSRTLCALHHSSSGSAAAAPTGLHVPLHKFSNNSTHNTHPRIHPQIIYLVYTYALHDNMSSYVPRIRFTSTCCCVLLLFLVLLSSWCDGTRRRLLHKLLVVG